MVVDVDSFIADGFVRVPGAVSSVLAREIRRQASLLMDEEPSEAWRLGQSSVYDLPVLNEALTPAVREAFDVLMGNRRWHLAANWGFPTRFPGPLKPRWHIDGDWFTHHLTSGEQVLTPIFLWSDVDDHDGPTLLEVGSHRWVARLLAGREPDGVPGPEIVQVIDAAAKPEAVVVATGEAGDVIVCHPFLAHTINPAGPATEPRFISNVCVHGYGPLQLSAKGDSSPVEVAIRQALDDG